MGHLNFPSYTPALAVLFLSLSLGWLIISKKLTPHQLPLPPGPKGLPILGNGLQINKSAPWLTYSEWKKSYGEIVSCKLLGQTIIIINSERVTKALLEQRSVIYSDRPVLKTSTLFGSDFNTAHLSTKNPNWKSHRKIFHKTVNSSVIPKYYDSIIEKTRNLLVNLLRSPEDFEDHMRTYSSSIIMSITYGYNVIPKDDPFVGPLDEMIHIIIFTSPERAILLHLFPQLANLPSWFPGAKYQRLAKQFKELSPRVRNGPFQFVKECLSKNIENNSMVAQLLKDDTVPAEDRAAYEQNIKDCATTSFIAGTDSSRSTLLTIIMALVLFPEVQDRAQATIDNVVGRDRLPDFGDAASLPYINALIRETTRWASLVPMGIPHMITKDDIFEQHLIPKGSIIIANVWGMARDEERFPDPTAFKPERHLDADGNLLPDDLTNLNFGYGRRLCPGRHLANASTWMAAVRILSMFRFSKAIGPAGYEIDVFPKFSEGVARRPLPFRCRITPRFEGAEELLK